MHSGTNPAARITLDRNHAFCVIGAGPSGLLAARALHFAGLNYDHLEQHADVGGVWNHADQREPPAIIARGKADLPAFPIPAAFPEYLERPQMANYLADFARAYGLYDRISFNQPVVRLEPTDDDLSWLVHLASGEVRRYRGVFICHGRNETPHMPKYPGTFAGPCLHSSDCNNNQFFKGLRVLIVGEGQAACDLACRAAGQAAQTLISTKYGFQVLPETLLGRPARELIPSPHLPTPIKNLCMNGLVKLAGRAAPKVSGSRMDLEAQPVIHSGAPALLHAGALEIRPDIAYLNGDRVRFRDGRETAVDVIVFATGFDPAFPFLDHDQFDWISGYPDLFLNAIHREYDNLCVLGCHLTEGNAYAHYNLQAAMMCQFIQAQDHYPSQADAFRRLKRDSYPNLGGGAQPGLPGYGIFARHDRFERYWRHSMRKMGWRDTPLKPEQNREEAAPTVFSLQ